ncbi:MAG: hypothetical protein DHS20C14_09040 [Phycisphaeraceae bacterium]|nr:MAG: hypothetical protein DHS20C14_09040 [Phycisphaeraceae bacterium]
MAPPGRGQFSHNDHARSSGARANTINATERDLVRLFDTFAAEGTAQGGSVHRLHARWPFARTSVNATIIHPGGSANELSFACRNLSRTGIGLLHSAFVHPGSRMSVKLPRPDGSVATIHGVVARCEHRHGVIHEVGIRFDEEIALPEYIPPDIFDGWLTFESVQPEKLSGSVLHVEPAPMDRKILGHFLRETDITMRQVEAGAEALGSAASGCDLIVCATTLPDMEGTEFVRQLRAAGNATPVILVGPEVRGSERSGAIECGADGYIRAPFEKDELLLGVAEFLLAEATMTRHVHGPGETSDENAAFANAHRARLRTLAGELEQLVAADRSIDAYVVCMQIKGIAPALGFGAIAKRAEWLAERMSTGQKAAALGEAAGELARACRDLRAA